MLGAGGGDRIRVEFAYMATAVCMAFDLNAWQLLYMIIRIQFTSSTIIFRYREQELQHFNMVSTEFGGKVEVGGELVTGLAFPVTMAHQHGKQLIEVHIKPSDYTLFGVCKSFRCHVVGELVCSGRVVVTEFESNLLT